MSKFDNADAAIEIEIGIELRLAGRPSSVLCPTCGASDWGTRNRCKPCRVRARQEERAKDVEKARLDERTRLRRWRRRNRKRVRLQTLRQLYGLDEAALERLLEAQGGRCAICRVEKPDCVDHCHATSRVRGLLCRRCNAALGQFRDDADLLLEASRYLEKHG